MAAKKALFLVNDAPFFISTHLSVARNAKKKGFEVHVAVPDSEKIREILDSEGFFRHNITFIRGKTNPLRELKSLWSVYSILRAIHPDIAHCVTLKVVIYAGIVTRLLGNIPTIHSLTGMGLIYTSKTLGVRFVRFIINPLLKYALLNPKALTIVQNPDDRDLLIRMNRVPSDQVTLIKGCGVNTDVFVPMRIQENKIPIVILTARMLFDKGIREFVDAAHILKKQGQKVRMVLVGPLDGKHPTAIPEAQLNKWKETGDVEFWGFQDDILKVLQGADIACLPSYREGLPTCLIEAASCGLPIVTTNVPGCREVVRDGINGILVPPADAHALAKALEELILNTEKRKRFGEVGRKIASDEFSVQHIISETMRVYDHLSEKHFQVH